MTPSGDFHHFLARDNRGGKKITNNQKSSNIVAHAARIFCCLRLTVLRARRINGSKMGLACCCRTLIQPLLHGSQTTLSFWLRWSPFLWSKPGPVVEVWLSMSMILTVWDPFPGGRYGWSHSAQTCSREIGVPPQNMHLRGGFGVRFSLATLTESSRVVGRRSARQPVTSFRPAQRFLRGLFPRASVTG
jgi:hypothetical protein